MARRRRAERRQPLPDTKYNSVELTRFINKIMLSGKKTHAQRIVYDALERVENEMNRPAIEIFEQAIRNSTPMLEVRSRRVGGATYQVPTEVRPERRLALAMRWLIGSSRSRGGSPMSQRLAQDLMEAARGQGAAVRRREELHRMAEANRAFAHYRW
ncbi:MAG: 30S ribosomal protein S7 [Chloroflexi bacterium]|nr:30S ribosomal protein S7 [Chloroflexota bacterium]